MAGGRYLERETIAGVPHFKPGQHHAALSPWSTSGETGRLVQVGRLTYVDHLGHLCVVVVCRGSEDEPWQATWVSRHGQYTDQEAIHVGEDGHFVLALSHQSLAALDAAEVVERG
jgi:hypothetical protein